MDGGIKIALEIDKMEKAGTIVTTKSILHAMKQHTLEEDEILDILFSLTKQDMLIRTYDDDLEEDIFKISRSENS